MAQRILMLCVRFPYPPNDGGTIAMFNMVSAYHQAGHEVTVFAMNTPKHYAHVRNLPDAVREMASFHAVDINTSPNAVDALGNMIFSRKSYHVQRFDSKAFRNSLEQLLEREKFDIVQLETLFMTPYIGSIRKSLPKAIIALRAHNIEHEIWDRKAQNEQAPWKKIFFEITAERLKDYELSVIGTNTLDAIVSVTERDGKEFKRLGAKVPVETCHIGLDLDKMKAALDPKIKMEEPSLFFIGALDWLPNQEGLDWFLKMVWPRIRKLYPKVKLYIAGRRMPNRFLNMNKPNVVIMGEVKDAYRFMQSKSIMVVPLLSGSGMRVKIVEGMAMGKAIVATQIAAEGLAIKNGDQAFITDDPKEFVNYVSILIEKPELVHALGVHAQNLVEKSYNNLDLIKRLLKFYSTLKKKESKDS